MSAIVVGPSPISKEKINAGDFGPANYMPFSVRHKVGEELNRLWAEFVEEMHDGPTSGPNVAEKFWRYVLAGGGV